MKKITFSIFALMLILTSCDWFDFGSKSNKSDSIGGSTNIPINTVGNTFSNSVSTGSAFYTGSISVTDVTDGVTTVKCVGKIPTDIPILQTINSKYKDASGNFVFEGKFKITDEGILDYNNKDKKPFVLVKYDAEVGDKYVLEKSDGTTITREVVRKSTTDDFYWNGMIIKTIDVETVVNTPGVKKVICFTNHKFGLVAVRVEMEDGTKPQLNLVPSKY
jgi:hypothetical protein